MPVKGLLQSEMRLDPLPVQDLYSFVTEGMKNNKQFTSFVDLQTEKSVSMTEALRTIDTLSRHLLRHGYRRGHFLVLYASNSVEYLLMVLAALRLGGKFATVNCQQTAGEAHSLFKLCDGVFLFTSGDTIVKSLTAVRNTNIQKVICLEPHPGCVSYQSMLEDLPSVSLPSVSSLNIRPKEETAGILFSSGTTGPQKAVMMSHYNFIAGSVALTCPQTRAIGTHTIIFVPMSHLIGLGTSISSLRHGACCLITSGFDPKLYLDTITKYKITHLQMPPPIVLFLAKHPMVNNYDLRHVEVIISGAAPLSGETEREACQRLEGPNIRMVQTYGMTEASGIMVAAYSDDSYRPSHVPPTPPGSTGRPVPFTEVKFVDPKTGQPVGPEEEAELWLRGPGVMLGYQKNKEQTDKTITSDGWLRSGDIGRYDKNGYIFITDRLKELIKYKGFQVAPAELEALLLTHPGVADCGVVGLPDERAGELPHAWVVRKPEAQVTEKDIVDFVQERVAQYKRLRGGVTFVEIIPKSPSGKILRREIRANISKSKL